MSIHHASRNFLVPLAIVAGLVTTAASAADLANNTGGPTTLTVGVPATFTMIAGINTLALPSNVPEKIDITTTANLGSLSATGPGWGTCTTTCNRMTAITAIAMFPTLTVTTTPTAAGPFKICGTISFVPNSSTLPDTFSGNDQSCVSGTVNPGAKPPDVAIKKGINGTPHVPGTFHFVLATVNYGPGSVGSGGVKVVDTIDPNFSIGAINNLPNWNCAVSGQTVTCTYIGPAVGASQPFPQISIEVKPQHKGNYKNTASITYYPPSGSPGETVLGNNSATIPVVVN